MAFPYTSLSIDLRGFGLTLGLVWTGSGNLLANLQLELARQRLGGQHQAVAGREIIFSRVCARNFGWPVYDMATHDYRSARVIRSAASSVQHQGQLRRYSISVSCFSDGIHASIRVHTPAVLTTFFALF